MSKKHESGEHHAVRALDSLVDVLAESGQVADVQTRQLARLADAFERFAAHEPIDASTARSTVRQSVADLTEVIDALRQLRASRAAQLVLDGQTLSGELADVEDGDPRRPELIQRAVRFRETAFREIQRARDTGEITLGGTRRRP